MATQEHRCYSVKCDACGAELEHDYNDGVVHFETAQNGLDNARDQDWCTTSTGGAVCDTEDDAHAKAASAHHGEGMEPNHSCWRLAAEVDASTETAAG